MGPCLRVSLVASGGTRVIAPPTCWKILFAVLVLPAKLGSDGEITLLEDSEKRVLLPFGRLEAPVGCRPPKLIFGWRRKSPRRDALLRTGQTGRSEKTQLLQKNQFRCELIDLTNSGPIQ